MHRYRVPWLLVLTGVVALLVPSAAQARAYASRTLHRGQSGHDVRVLQRALTKLDLTVSADGNFGSRTESRAKSWERRNNRTATGRLSRIEQRRIRSQSQSASSNTKSTTTTKASLARRSGTLKASAPSGAPSAVRGVIRWANKITDKPYRYGGGHARFTDSGYDCSGAVSYALRGAVLSGGRRLLGHPLDSNSFAGWGSSGRGRWITVYTNPSHAYAVIAGRRWDTSGSGGAGPRWHRDTRSSSGFTARHWPGL